ncbi:P-loop containing nucleoside triphosphate hydrolase protein [Ramaria rubella]|nr:P-loop containing nucleoside triphosphate hydrolase protein [Ramaria rubella]
MATTSNSDLKLFIARQLLLLERERDAEIERTSLLISNCSHKLLEQKGLALCGLGVVSVAIGLGGKSLVELERPSAYHTTSIFPPHTLRPGDLSRIDEHVSTAKKFGSKSGAPAKDAANPINGVVYKVSDTRIVIAVDPSSSDEELDIPERCSLIKLANTVTHDRMRRAIEQLSRLVLPEEDSLTSTSSEPRRANAGPNPLHRVLLGLSTPTITPLAPPSILNLVFDPLLNPSQLTAVKFALGAPEVACIHGPPGTGKTRVLVEIIRQLVYAPGEPVSELVKKTVKILVCGASNLAVDNLLERLSVPAPLPATIKGKDSSEEATSIQIGLTAPIKEYPPIALTRLGHPARVMASLHSRTLDAQAQASAEATLAKDVKAELEDIMAALSGKGLKAKKGQRLRGEARKEAWRNVRDLRKEYRKREEGVVKSVLSKAQVVLSTCHGAGSKQLQNTEFDVVIIDEATQALEAVCWIPILKAKKLVLAGDPMQLGPTIISEGNRRHAKAKLSKTAKKPIEISTSKGGNKRTTAPEVKRQDSAPAPSTVELENKEETSDSDSSNTDSSSTNDTQPNTKNVETQPAPAKAKVKPSLRSLLRPPKTLGTTLFDRLETMYNAKIKRMLVVQYRMNTKISAFPSKTLYQSRLTSHSSNASRLLCDLPGVSSEEEHEDVVGVGSEVVFWDTAGAEFWERSGNDGESVNIKISGDDGGSLCNENEAEVVKRWVNRLMAAGVLPSQIAIITPYQAQSQILSAMLPVPELEIGTADGMQGRENEAVVLSLVRSNPEGEVGFLKEKRRLNVAMTRAKRHLCVVGDSSTIRRGGGKYLKKWMAWLESEADVRFAGDV